MLSINELAEPSAEKKSGRSRKKRDSWSSIKLEKVLLLALFVFMFQKFYLTPLDIGHDLAYLIEAGRLLSEGKLPYVDFITLSPIQTYLNMVPVLLARLLSLHPIPVYNMIVLLLVVFSTLVIRSLLKKSRFIFGQSDLHWLMIAWVGFSLYLQLGYNLFGHREHLFILVYFPFFIIRWIRWEEGEVRRKTAVLLGFAVSVGAFLKPHFIIIMLAPELYWIVTRRSFRQLARLEIAAFICFGLAYAAHFIFLPEIVREQLFDRWLPFIARWYPAFGPRYFMRLIDQNFIVFSSLAVFPFLLNKPELKSDLWKMARPVSCMTIAALIVYLLLRKAFFYQFIVALGGVSIIMALTAIQLGLFDYSASGDRQEGEKAFDRKPILQRGRFLILVLISGLIFVRVSWEMERNLRRYNLSLNNQVTKLISQYSGKEDPILFISPYVMPVYPTLLQMNRRPGSRYLTSFPIPLFYVNNPKEDGKLQYFHKSEMPPEQVLFLDELTEDISRNQPPLIFVDYRTHEGGSTYAYLYKSGFIDSAMSDYKTIVRIENFVVFLRKDMSGDNPPMKE